MIKSGRELVCIVSHAVRKLAAAVLLRAIRDASGDVGECPERLRAFYQKDAVEFFVGGDYEYWADLAEVSIPASVLRKLTV